MNFEYIEVRDIDDFINFVEASLRLWLAVHTDAESWAADWCLDCGWQWLLKTSPVIGNDYFSFDLRDACLRQLAEDTIGDYCQCSECGSITEWSYLDCRCEDGEETELDDVDQLYWYLEGMDMVFDDYTIQNAMIEKAFPVYYHALECVIGGVIEEVEDALDQIGGADSNQERLGAALMASHICHVNGNILVDYGKRITDLTDNMIESIQQDGLISLFSQDEIDDFVSDECY